MANKVKIEFDLYTYNLDGEFEPQRQIIYINKEDFDKKVESFKSSRIGAAKWFVKRAFRREKIEIIEVI